MVGANFQSLVSSHNQARSLVLLVLQESDFTSSTLFPLLALSIELEQLGTHLEALLLEFLICLGLNLLSQADNGLEIDVWFSLDILQKTQVNHILAKSSNRILIVEKC